MRATDARDALAAAKPRRPHPASPDAAVTARDTDTSSASGRSTSGDGRVMLCVRVPVSLRKRVKLAALQGVRSVQELVTEALEAECRRRGV